MSYLNNLREATNYTTTENGAVTHKSTLTCLYDMFALGGSYRTRTDEDIIVLFKNAYIENSSYALKCLFYLRDILEGQGERRFFRVCMEWLAQYDTEAAERNLKQIPVFGRWDDLFCFMDTPLRSTALTFIKEQLALDVQSKTPSLLAKWLPSENASSIKTKKLAHDMRVFLGMTARQYRKTLSVLRERINVLERLMSAGEWGKIEFDKIPSKAGFKYRNAFARHDIERIKAGKTAYEKFIKDEDTAVNAKVLYPYEVVYEAVKAMIYHSWSGLIKNSDPPLDNTERLAINKYWDNLKDWFDGQSLDALAVVDTSGSMTGSNADAPINVAISLGLYCAERAKGPFAGHYISFSSRPQLIRTEGVDFCDKIKRIYSTNLCENTNIEATFDLLLRTAVENYTPQKDMPGTIIIISDQEFDYARTYLSENTSTATLMERISHKWLEHGYIMPKLVFWNVDARHNNIPMRDQDGVTFVSGCSPVIYEMVLSGKTGQDMMFDKLNNERYKNIK